MTRMSVTVQARGFQVDYPGFTLGPLDFALAKGERVALVGHNGAGKSTAMRALSGRTVDYGGSLDFEGRELREAVPEVRGRIGLLPEKPASFDWMTVREHFALLESLQPLWDATYAEVLRSRLGLPAETKVGNLSRGMSVKLSFIAAEAFHPPLLLLDEPTAGLDPGMREEILDLVLGAVPGGSARAVVFSTHVLEDIHLLADRILVLRQGRLIADSPLAALVDAAGEGGANRRLRELMSGRG